MGLEYYSFDKVLKELQMDEDELRRLVSDGQIRAFREEDKMRFRKDDIEGLKKGRVNEPTIILPPENLIEELRAYENNIGKKLYNVFSEGVEVDEAVRSSNTDGGLEQRIRLKKEGVGAIILTKKDDRIYISKPKDALCEADSETTFEVKESETPDLFRYMAFVASQAESSRKVIPLDYMKRVLGNIDQRDVLLVKDLVRESEEIMIVDDDTDETLLDLEDLGGEDLENKTLAPSLESEEKPYAASKETIPVEDYNTVEKEPEKKGLLSRIFKKFKK